MIINRETISKAVYTYLQNHTVEQTDAFQEGMQAMADIVDRALKEKAELEEKNNNHDHIKFVIKHKDLKKCNKKI